MKPALEFSRPVPLAGLEEGGDMRLVLAADAAERAALARRFGCAGIASLRADVRLARHGRRVTATVALAARARQVCVVSLAPFEVTVEERFETVFDPDLRPGERGIEDDEAEALVGDSVELGEPVAQRFALALDPYPRKPGAVLDPRYAGDDRGNHPFAVLGRLKDDG